MFAPEEINRVATREVGQFLARPTIFALTAEDLEGDKNKFLDLGFDGKSCKPLQAGCYKSC